jgi:hypothetical protein
MLRWAEGRRRTLPPGPDGRSTLTTTAFAHDARRVAWLTGRGASAAIVNTPHTNAPARALYESVGFSIVGSEHDYVIAL